MTKSMESLSKFFPTTATLFVVILLGNFVAHSSPLKATDKFSSSCSQVSLSSTPLLWSRPSTWPSGVVPGTGSATGVDVTIPCGRSILMDVPLVNLGTLFVKGLLLFKDHPSLPLIYVKANFVIVEGQFQVGTPAQQFSQKLVVELTPSRNRDSFRYTSLPPADSSFPRDVGHKAFVVIGGQVSLHGLPGGQSMPVWCKLRGTAAVGEKAIAVNCDARSWPKGSEIVITSTDYDRKQAEKFFVQSVRKSRKGSVIRLSKPLIYEHFGDAKLSDGMGGKVDERAEVALLTRNIQIKGTVEAGPYELEGGHFMVYMTNEPRQYIEGVQFINMGQQGTLGRYPIHFHILGDVPGTICRKNTIQESHQRCIVLHATHSVLVEENVAYDTSGHCFMTEEGGERNNRFIRNLGALTKASKNLIKVTGDAPPLQTDSSPSTFWLTNALNTLEGNVAAGSSDTGFWFEMVRSVRGNSLTIPDLNSTVPIITSPQKFTGNVAHSNAMTGLRTYPFGMRPRKLPDYSDGTPGVIDNFLAFKNGFYGMFIHNTDLLVIKNSTFADNLWSLHLNQDARVTVEDSRFIAVTDNLGNPSKCAENSFFAPCRRPSSTCKTLGKGFAPTFGVVIDQGRSIDLAQSIYPNYLRNLRFSNYDPTCSTAAGIAFTGQEAADFWNPGHNSEGIQFSENTQPVWFAPKVSQLNPFTKSNGGEQSQFYTLFDKDGSLGGSRGYIVADNAAILPAGKKDCRKLSRGNAYSCKGVCYRTVMISYPEAGFSRSDANKNNQRGDFSYLMVTRVADGAVLSLDGNLQSSSFPDPVRRYYFLTLLADQSYNVEVVGPQRNPSFSPSLIRVRYGDSGECGRGLSLRFKHSSGQPWTVPQGASMDYKHCGGAMGTSGPFSSSQFQTVCLKGQPWLEISLSPLFSKFTEITKGEGPISCSSPQYCSILRSGASDWLYDASGVNRSPQFFQSSLASWWKRGSAPLGKQSYDGGIIKTFLPGPSGNLLTYFYRHDFTIASKKCYSALLLSVVVHDGFVLYLNGVESLRVNLPSGKVSATTLATTYKGFMKWEKFILPLQGEVPYSLQNGLNFVAVEQHGRNPYSSETSFDMRITAVQR